MNCVEPDEAHPDLPPLCDVNVTEKEAFLQQVIASFNSTPTLNNVIHGLREIRLGKRNGSRTSYFPSRKNATGNLYSVYLPMDSRLEARYAIDLERSMKVLAFRVQAVELDVPDGKAYPDFLILDTAGRLHVREVKADKRYLDEREIKKFGYMTSKLASWGVGFAVVDTADLPEDAKYENLQWLHQQVPDISVMNELDEFLRYDFKVSTFGKLMAACRDMGLSESLVPYALFTEQLKVDWSRTINDDSEVRK